MTILNQSNGGQKRTTFSNMFICPKCQSNDHEEISEDFCIEDSNYHVKCRCNNCGYLYSYRFGFDFYLDEEEEN